MAALIADAFARATDSAGDLLYHAVVLSSWGPQATLYTVIVLNDMVGGDRRACRATKAGS